MMALLYALCRNTLDFLLLLKFYVCLRKFLVKNIQLHFTVQMGYFIPARKMSYPLKIVIKIQYQYQAIIRSMISSFW